MPSKNASRSRPIWVFIALATCGRFRTNSASPSPLSSTRIVSYSCFILDCSDANPRPGYTDRVTVRRLERRLMQTIDGKWREAAAVTLIDAHHHLWDLRMGKHPWLCGAEEKPFFMGDYTPLKRDYLPDDYRRDAVGH